MIFIPPKDTEHCIMNFFDTKTGENLGQVEDIEEVNMTSEYQIDYGTKECLCLCYGFSEIQ